MKFHFRDRNSGMAVAWKAVFRSTPDITISLGDIFAEDVPAADAIVSPANSFGFMDGGIDMVYSQYFGWDVEKRLQLLLQKEHDGMLPVGQAVIVKTGREERDPTEPPVVFNSQISEGAKTIACKRFPYLISAPTMTIPMTITGTINAYLAMRAVIRAVKAHNLKVARNELDDTHTCIETILCPGLGTAIGKLPYEIAAVQMYEAYKTSGSNKCHSFDDLGEAWSYHENLRRGQT